MIIAALVTFGALLACWLLAASDPEADRQLSLGEPKPEPAAPDLARAA
jgi:hypothetical protein